MDTVLVTVLLVVAGVGAAFAVVRLAKGNGAAASAGHGATVSIQPVDLAAFRNLVDPEEEEYLRQGLPPVEFRRVHRQRARAALGYISCVSQNAAALLRVGEAARRNADPSVVRAGDELVNSALRLRIYALQARGVLCLQIAFPGMRVRPRGIAENYERVTDLVAILRCLQYPTRQIAS